MSLPPDPRPLLSPENSNRLTEALRLCQELQSPEHSSDTKLAQLRRIVAHCRRGIDRQGPAFRRQRLAAVDQARNFLHFLPSMQHAEAPGRLRSVSRRLRLAMRA